MSTITRRTMLASAGVLALSSVAACGSESSSSSSSTSSTSGVKIARSSWIGFFPLDVAVEKGFFTDHGVTVETVSIESKADSKSALAAGRIQAIATTVDTNLMTSTQGVDITIPLVLDTSKGADGLVGKSDISSFADLKGRTVALDTTGGASYFWFNYELKEAGMTLDDVTVESMTSGDAGSAFVSGKVDAAMTWQPWLDKASETDFGHVVMSSADAPGVIVDCLGFSSDFVADNPDQVEGIIAGWYDALAYMESNPEDANAIIAEVAGETADEAASQLEEIEFYDKAGNKEFFGTKDAHGPIYDLAEQANTIWRDAGLTTEDADLDALIDPTFASA